MWSGQLQCIISAPSALLSFNNCPGWQGGVPAKFRSMLIAVVSPMDRCTPTAAQAPHRCFLGFHYLPVPPALVHPLLPQTVTVRRAI